MAEATEYANQIAREKNEADLARLRAAGTTKVYVPTAAERLALKRALAPVHAQAEARLGRALLQDVYRAAGYDPDQP
jgi:C4-dicarboxylate-binding protein DctP